MDSLRKQKMSLFESPQTDKRERKRSRHPACTDNEESISVPDKTIKRSSSLTIKSSNELADFLIDTQKKKFQSKKLERRKRKRQKTRREAVIETSSSHENERRDADDDVGNDDVKVEYESSGRNTSMGSESERRCDLGQLETFKNETLSDRYDAPNQELSSEKNTYDTEDLLAIKHPEYMNPLIKSPEIMEKEDKVPKNYCRYFMMKNKYFLPCIDPKKMPMVDKVIKWILKHDFSLPKVQFIPKNLFRVPNKFEMQRMLAKSTNFTLKEFEIAEDAVIVQRLSFLMKALNLSSRDGFKFIKQIARLGEQGNCHYARLFLGAYIGRPMLEYRRIHDIFIRLCQLAGLDHKIKSLQSTKDLLVDMTSWLVDNGAHYKKCLRLFNASHFISEKELEEFFLNKERIKYIPRTKRHTPELLRLIIKKAMVVANSTDILNLTEKEMKKVCSDIAGKSGLGPVYRLWRVQILPTLNRYCKDQMIPLRREVALQLFRSIKASGVQSSRKIKWSEISSQIPGENVNSLKKLFTANQYVATKSAKCGKSFSEKVDFVIDRLAKSVEDNKNYEQDSRKHLTKSISEVIEAYEEVKAAFQGPETLTM